MSTDTEDLRNALPLDLLARIEEAEKARIEDLGLKKRVADVAGWLLEAIAAGVIGNVSYDVLKQLWRKIQRRPNDLPSRVLDYRHVSLIAILAVQARCGQLFLPIPSTTSIRILSSKKTDFPWQERRHADWIARGFGWADRNGKPISDEELDSFERDWPGRPGWEVHLVVDDNAMWATVFVPEGNMIETAVEVSLLTYAQLPDRVKEDDDFNWIWFGPR